MDKNNWRSIPTEVIEEAAEAYGMTAGELIYAMMNGELSKEMEDAIEAAIENSN